MRVQHHGSVCVVSGTVNLLKEQFDREFSHPTPRLTHGGNWVNSWIAGPEGVAILESGWDLRLSMQGRLAGLLSKLKRFNTQDAISGLLLLAPNV